MQHFDAVPVERVEGLDFFAVVADEDAAVGEHAVHVHNQQFDFGGAAAQVFGQFGQNRAHAGNLNFKLDP